MNLTVWVDIAIGLTVVYLGSSLFVTVINEYIAQALNLRGKQLCRSLMALFNDKDVKKLLAQSPALKPFFDTSGVLTPSYVDPNIVARLLVGGVDLSKLPASDLKTQLQAIKQTAGATADAAVKAVSEWVDGSLTMLGEAYKRNLQKISFAIGITLAVAFNLDTVTLTEHLYRDKETRDAAVAIGAQVAEKTSPETFKKCLALKPEERKKETSCAPLEGLVDAVQGRTASLGKLPIGWPLAGMPSMAAVDSGVVQFWGLRLVGWLLTALAVSLGAPFWFDLLNRFVNVRYGMRKPEVKGEK